MESNKCIRCNKELSKRQNKYCSNECKLSDPNTTKRMSNSKSINDKSLIAISLIDGTRFKDHNNVSGAITRHLIKNNINDKEWQKYIRLEKFEQPSLYSCKYCDWTTKDLVNKSGCITVHLKDKHDITPTQHIENYPEESSFWSYTHSRELKEVFLGADPDQYIKCEECGEKFRSITGTHLLHEHDMTIDEYRIKYPLAPTKCNSYIERSKELYEQRYDEINKHSLKSNGEKEILEFIRSLGIEAISGERKIVYPLELDIYVPEYKIAIEYNGLFYHSEFSNGKLKDYHINKTQKCEEKNIHLIHIFEDEWINKKDIVKYRILNMLGKLPNKVFARKTNVKEISTNEKGKFLEKYHIQGNDKSKINIGLYENDQLVSVMTFSHLRKALGYSNIDQNEYELSRFCSNKNVIGGASKMFKYFIDIHKPSKVISYADRRWTPDFKSAVYETLGFTRIGVTKPNYWYTRSYHKRLHRYNFTKQRLVKEFGADPNLTEVQNMINLGYDRIWDCGSIRYIWENKFG